MVPQLPLPTEASRVAGGQQSQNMAALNTMPQLKAGSVRVNLLGRPLQVRSQGADRLAGLLKAGAAATYPQLKLAFNPRRPMPPMGGFTRGMAAFRPAQRNLVGFSGQPMGGPMMGGGGMGLPIPGATPW